MQFNLLFAARCMLSLNKTSSEVFDFAFLIYISGNAERFLEKRKTDHFSKDKTHKTLTRKNLLGISLSVAKVTVFETSEGTANRVVTLCERATAERFVVAIDAQR
jgi:hypothetical protein